LRSGASWSVWTGVYAQRPVLMTRPVVLTDEAPNQSSDQIFELGQSWP
jgi:hypothetical protein